MRSLYPDGSSDIHGMAFSCDIMQCVPPLCLDQRKSVSCRPSNACTMGFAVPLRNDRMAGTLAKYRSGLPTKQ